MTGWRWGFVGCIARGVWEGRFTRGHSIIEIQHNVREEQTSRSTVGLYGFQEELSYE